VPGGFSIDSEAFEQYAEETNILYLQSYCRSYMSGNIHKMLFYGAKINAIALVNYLEKHRRPAKITKKELPKLKKK
jgi:hypothetical protein